MATASMPVGQLGFAPHPNLCGPSYRLSTLHRITDTQNPAANGTFQLRTVGALAAIAG